MSETKWTPGPWFWNGSPDLPKITTHETTVIDSFEYENMWFTSCDFSVASANCRLIAAAPELYDALEYMLSVCPAIDSIGEEARQEAHDALAKARGES